MRDLTAARPDRRRGHWTNWPATHCGPAGGAAGGNGARSPLDHGEGSACSDSARRRAASAALRSRRRTCGALQPPEGLRLQSCYKGWARAGER
jgi:hypothetical protein